MFLISSWALIRLRGVCVVNFLLPVCYLQDPEVICILEKHAIKAPLQANPCEYMDQHLYNKYVRLNPVSS